MSAKHYELTTIQDILDKVPADRIQECCREIGQGLAQAALMRDLATSCGAEIIGIQWPIVWADDGKHEVDAILSAKDENGETTEILRLEVRPEKQA